MLETVSNVLRSLSARQWLKNGLIFIPAIFAAAHWDSKLIVELFLGFWGFSLIASAVYINNDLTDIRSDQQHPKKKFRAIASERISRDQAIVLLIVLLTTGLATLTLLSTKIAAFGGVYVVINWAYSTYLKRVPIVDLLAIVSGYFIRLLIGQEVAQAPLSPWILGFVGILAVYLVLLKRLGDVQLFQTTGIAHRSTVAFYSKLRLSTLTLVLSQLLLVFFAGYIHFVFIQHQIVSPSLAYSTIPLTYASLILYHRSAMKHIDEDPIQVLLKNYWSLFLLLVSFALLIIALYPNA